MFIWSTAVLAYDSLTGANTFQTEGFVPISEETYGDSRMTCSFHQPKGRFLFIPKYLSDEQFFFVSLDSENVLRMGAVVEGVEKTYGELSVTPKTRNDLMVSSNGSHFTISLNGTQVYQLESALFTNGSVRLYGEEGEIFYQCTMEEPQSTDWITNGNQSGVEIKAVAKEGTVFMKLTGSEDTAAEMKQTLKLPAGTYCFSFYHEGIGRSKVLDATNHELANEFWTEEDVTRSFVSFTLSAEMEVTLLLETHVEWFVGKIQVEIGSYPTPYLPTDADGLPSIRETTYLSYPLKADMPLAAGTLYVEISAPDTFHHEAITEPQLVFRTNDEQLRLTYGPDGIVFTQHDKTLTSPSTLSAGETAAIWISWQANEMELTVNGETWIRTDNHVLSTGITHFIFAEGTSIYEPMILEEWALFPHRMTAVEPVETILPYAIMQSLFDGGISGQNVTWVELPVAPIDHSPIIVQKEDGTPLRKVSFFDHETGTYRAWNEEPFVYNGRDDFVEVAYSSLNEQFRRLALRTEEGEKIGEPYHVDGKRFYFSLAEEEKLDLKNQTLLVTYQVNNSFTVDYNIKAADGYRLDFSKHDGKKRWVYQEGNRYGEPAKLATMIELNPLYNYNHEGFLYITQTLHPAHSFRLTATPDRLHADGASVSTIVIEPLDFQGNYLSHARLQVSASKGFIARHISQEAAEAQKRAGHYLYQYVSPYIQATVEGEQVEDYIWIMDDTSHIGTVLKIILQPVQDLSRPPLSQAEKETLLVKTKVMESILLYEGIELYEDETLVSILDLNEDGRITTDEIRLLETNEKDGALSQLLQKLEDWEE